MAQMTTSNGSPFSIRGYKIVSPVSFFVVVIIIIIIIIIIIKLI